jgi:hypothetical protein
MDALAWSGGGRGDGESPGSPFSAGILHGPRLSLSRSRLMRFSSPHPLPWNSGPASTGGRKEG